MEIYLKMNFAMIFPGQSPFNINYLINLINNYPKIKKTFDEASNHLNYNLYKLLLRNRQNINNYYNYKPAILLATSISIYRLWKKCTNLYPKIVAGHSLGEYAALVCSQCISFHDALKLVTLRNDFMKESMLGRTGLMIAIIGLNINIIFKICKIFSVNGLVTIASINSESEIVITGHKNNVYLAALECKKKGAKAIFKLSISIASHCNLMKLASEKLLLILKQIKFHKPLFPIINNINIKCEFTSYKIINALVEQLIQPIYWKKTINHIISKKISILLEVGPNKILTNLNKSLNNITSISLNNPKNFKKAIKTIHYGAHKCEKQNCINNRF